MFEVEIFTSHPQDERFQELVDLVESIVGRDYAEEHRPNCPRHRWDYLGTLELRHIRPHTEKTSP